MRVFVSYSGTERSQAEEIAAALRSEGRTVFLDRKDLPPGANFDERIRKALKASQLLVFLISPSSVEPGGYPRTELKFAQELWPNPSDRILPVVVKPTPIDRIPPHLKPLTFLEPTGNLVAEVLAEVERVANRRSTLLTRRMLMLGTPLLVLLAVLGWYIPSFLPSFPGLGESARWEKNWQAISHPPGSLGTPNGEEYTDRERLLAILKSLKLSGRPDLDGTKTELISAIEKAPVETKNGPRYSLRYTPMMSALFDELKRGVRDRAIEVGVDVGDRVGR